MAPGKINITRLFNLELLAVKSELSVILSLIFAYRMLCFKSSAFVVLVQGPVV